MHTPPPCPDTLRRRAPARKKTRILACLLALGAAALLGILSSAQNIGDHAGHGTAGLRNALAQDTLTVSDRLPGSEAKHPSPLLPPARRTPDVDALFPRLAGLQVLPENWLLNGAAAQRLGFTADETKALNAHLARMREEFCASETSRMKIQEEDGATVIVIPPHDGNPMRRKLYDGITAIAGPERVSAAGLIWSYAKDRAETDFAWFGENAVHLKFTPAAKNGTRAWGVEFYESSGSILLRTGPISLSSANNGFSASLAVEAPTPPLRYAHLWKPVP
ncbi:MAG TPA: hypothetical protein VG796_05740 [Verrucomicrobiales bacterium]|nr:hypothetical protein [Verrucomicrobiales bacterium]